MLTDIWTLMRDAAWTPIAMFVGLCTALVIYRWQHQRKELACGAISSNRLISIADSVSSRVKVLLDDTPVTDLHLHVYGFKNSGTKAIAESDFSRPLSLIFSEGSIVSVQILSQYPASLNAQLTEDERKVEIAPLLLNAGDFVVIQVLVSAKTLPAIDFRIKDIPKAYSLNKAKAFDAYLMPVLGIGIAAISIQVAYGHLQNDNWIFFILGLVLTALFGGASLARLSLSSGSARRRRINY